MRVRWGWILFAGCGIALLTTPLLIDKPEPNAGGYAVHSDGEFRYWVSRDRGVSREGLTINASLVCRETASAGDVVSLELHVARPPVRGILLKFILNELEFSLEFPSASISPSATQRITNGQAAWLIALPSSGSSWEGRVVFAGFSDFGDPETRTALLKRNTTVRLHDGDLRFRISAPPSLPSTLSPWISLVAITLGVLATGFGLYQGVFKFRRARIRGRERKKILGPDGQPYKESS